jgi:hypothetical protein
MKSQPGCPKCGGEMVIEATFDGYMGEYWECTLCGYWENHVGTSRVMSVGNIGGQLNFDNEDGWPCR